MKTRKLLMAVMTAASVMFFTSCEEDPCKDVTCVNGVPTETATGGCECDCDTGYEGADCSTVSRDKFIGTFNVSDACSASGSATYSCAITASGTDITKVLISNFWDSFLAPVQATIDGSSITIANQEPDGDGFTVSGTGTISGNVITISYTVTDTSTSDTDVCQGTFTKQ